MFYAQATGESGLVRSEPAPDFAACLSRVRALAERYPALMISARCSCGEDSFDGLSEAERILVTDAVAEGRRIAVERSVA